MASVYLPDRRTDGNPDPAEVITATLNGVTYRAGRRTVAHLTATDDALRTKGYWLRLIQPPYRTGVAASAGTHDYDGVVDCEVEGATWTQGQRLMRELGWASWYRPNTPGLWGDHLHQVSIGCPGPVGIYVPDQIADYYAHRSGLKGHAPDNTWHPADIDSTIFDYPRWTEEQDMSPEQEDRIVDRVVKALTEGKPAGSDLSRDSLLKQAQKASVEARDLLRKKP